MALENELKRVVAALSGINENDLHSDTKLVSTGLIDSMSILDLVSAIDDLAGIMIETEDMTLDNLDTIANIIRFITNRKNSN